MNTSVSLEVATIVLGKSLSDNKNLTPLPSQISFTSTITPISQPVSLPAEQSRYAGLLYTPTLSSKCTEMTASIPTNLTLQDLPAPIGLIAFAPASNCMEFYIMQAALDGAKAVILYPVSSSSSPTLSLDAGALTAAVPVYFAAWQDAQPIAMAMNQYNTDLLDVPFGLNLSASGLYPADDYVRLVMTVNRASSHSLPGLWIFLLIVLGLLCLIVAVTSVGMHAHQYFARRDLRRRIAAGQVDLEVLGIKRLTVPKNYIDALPQRVWKDNHDKMESTSTSSNPNYDQTSCTICLEDFVPNVTTIRDLPCHHIYHSECIDPFLHKRSSLCPLCKQSVLPKGYIPPDVLLTSATIMRERRYRRQQQTRGSRVSRSISSDLEMQITRLSSAAEGSRPHPAAVSDLAPDNEEEERAYRPHGRIRRLWHIIFPVHST